MANRTEPTLSQIHHIILPLALRAGQMLTSRQKGVAELPPKGQVETTAAAADEVRTLMVTTIPQILTGHTVLDPHVSTAPSEWRWIVNPLDGGSFYGRGLSLYALSLALQRQGEVVLGIVIEPATQIVFHAFKGEGARMNNRPLSISSAKSLANAHLCFESSSTGLSAAAVKHHAVLWQAFSGAGSHLQDLGVSLLNLCYTAAGSFDAFVGFQEDGMLIKLAAALFIAKEAGAILTDGDGKPLSTKSASPAMLVVSPGLSKSCLSLLRSK